MPLSGLENLTGTTISIAVGEPGTYDTAGYKAMTWAEIVGLVEFGEWGDSNADVSEPILSEGRVIHTNGILDGGEVPVAVQHRDTDAGRDIILAQGGTNNLVSFMKTYPSGDREWGTGVVGSQRQRAASNDAIRGFTTMARINTALVRATSAEYDAA